MQTNTAQLQLRQAVEIPDTLLLIDAVTVLTGLSKPTIYRKTRHGEFLEPVRMGTRCTRWRAGDVTTWLRAKANA
jgi:prophage regulatory protein